MQIPAQRLFSNRKLITMIIPLILENFFILLVGFVDGIMVSTVGEAAISGISLVNSISGIVISLFVSLSAGGAIVTSQFLGAGKRDRAQQSAGQLILMVAGVSTLFSIACLLLTKELLVLCFGNAEQDVMDAAVTYFRIIAFSFPLVGLNSAGTVIFRCSGNTGVSLKVSLISNLVNVVGNAICIYGLNMGVAGAAIPTLISRGVSVVLIFGLLQRSKDALRPAKEDLKTVDWPVIKDMLKLGLPAAFEGCMFQLGSVLSLSMITLFGTHHITAHSTAITLIQFTNIPVNCLNSLSLMIIGQCVGAKDEIQIRYYVRKLMCIGYVASWIVMIAMYLLRYPLLSLYASLSEETVRLTVTVMTINLSCGLFLFTPSFFLSGPLRAANDSMYTMLVGVLSMMVLRLGIAYVLCVVMEMGVVGVWIAMVIDWVNRSAWFGGRYLSGAWKKKCGMA